MIKSMRKKSVLAAVLVLLAFVTCCISVYAEPKFENEQIYFEYSDGVVRDGARHDEPGIIGDEFKYENNARNTRNADESTNAMTTFWGIVVALVVAASVVMIIALVTPKSREQDRR